MTEEFKIFEEQRKLVLARFQTLKSESKLVLGGDKEISVKDIIKHIKENDEFGKQAIKIEMKMLRVLANV
jgi:hypothetical protein